MDDVAKQCIGVCWAILIVYMIVAALGTKRTVERPTGQWRIWLLAGAMTVFALRKSGIAPWISAAQVVLWQRTPAVGLVADILTISGLAIALWARAALGSNWSAFVAFKENHELIERGPYQYVRHPMYSGILLMILGGTVFYGVAGGFVVLLLAFAWFGLKASSEERLLLRHFPRAYRDYKTRVRALIPYVF